MAGRLSQAITAYIVCEMDVVSRLVDGICN